MGTLDLRTFTTLRTVRKDAFQLLSEFCSIHLLACLAPCFVQLTDIDIRLQHLVQPYTFRRSVPIENESRRNGHHHLESSMPPTLHAVVVQCPGWTLIDGEPRNICKPSRMRCLGFLI